MPGIETIANNVPGGLTVPTATTTPSDTIDQEGFLQLLVAQIQNQDPLEPLSNEEFVQQLTSFSSLDELREIKEGMTGLGQLEDIAQLLSANLGLQQAAVNASTVGLIGNQVEAASEVVNLGSGENGQIGFELPDGGATSVSIQLVSASGQPLYATQFNPTNPPPGVTVEGNRVYMEVPTEGPDGAALPSGPARIIIEGITPAGNVPIESTVRGAVAGIDFRGTSTQVTIGGTSIDLVNVLAVNRA